MRPLILLCIAPLLAACAESPPPYTPAYYAPQLGPQAIAYRMPVVGDWFVIRTHYGNTSDQAYALDLGILVGARTHKGDGRKNTDYAAYGQPVVADAPGVVVIAVDGIPENVPGVANSYDMHGNYVVIDHQNGEFSLVAHLIPGTLRVRPGQQVQAGAELGRCGNSGHSSEPHVHWQVMDKPLAHTARPIQPRFAPYLKNGAVTTERPDRHDKISPPPAS